MTHEMKITQSKNQNIGEPIELIKFLCLVTMTRDIYLKMDKVGYHIFINLLVYHTKIISSNIDNLL